MCCYYSYCVPHRVPFLSLYDLAKPWAQPTVDTIDAIRLHVNLAATSSSNIPDQVGAPKLIIDLSSFRVACVIDQGESSNRYLVEPEPFGSGPTLLKRWLGELSASTAAR